VHLAFAIVRPTLLSAREILDNQTDGCIQCWCRHLLLDMSVTGSSANAEKTVPLVIVHVLFLMINVSDRQI